jgi:LPS-assembly protein
MSARKTRILLSALAVGCTPAVGVALDITAPPDTPVNYTSVSRESVAKQLGWVESSDNICGGYYLDQPFPYPTDPTKKSAISITSEQGGVFSQQSTSTLEGNVTVTRDGQQITADKAFLYRDPTTGKISSIDMIGDVHLREPNTLIIGKKARYNFVTRSKSLMEIHYRTAFAGRQVVGPNVSREATLKPRMVTTQTVWGKAYEFSQTEPQIYELFRASYTTCPPIDPTWRLKASHIVLNKNTGRGYATHARIYVKNVPVFYLPYINFPIDKRRKSGFLWPTAGSSNQWGPYFLAPYYFNLAPNYDMTLTTGYLSKRGLRFTDNFRYLSPYNHGYLNVSVLPSDREFARFKKAAPDLYGNSSQPQNVTDAELNRLHDSSDTRKSFVWRDDAQFNEHWSTHLDFNYVGDDYYLKNFGNSFTEVSQDQLLQEADLNFKSQHWDLITRLQAYQTLHPVDELPVQNAYRRLPQIILNGDYPDNALGLDYFINAETAHFDILNNPGNPIVPLAIVSPTNLSMSTATESPIGNRFHLQPGISLPLNWTSFYIDPRLQVDLTQYQLHQNQQTLTPGTQRRSVPIFDVASGFSLARETTIFSHDFQQTLEPQVYYTYIPYRDQSKIPVFDTTVNTLTYDQIFNYNRFSGIDRINDANQIAAGITSRFIDQETGFEKAKLGLGEIIYFANRRVTLCNSKEECEDNPQNNSNFQRLSPLSGLFHYNVNPVWSFNAEGLWDPIDRQIINSTLKLQYLPDDKHIVNLGYGYARAGNTSSGVIDSSNANNNVQNNNLKLTDFSFVWPLTSTISAVGRWTQDWNTNHFQNLLYGLQYDACCWAVQFVGDRAYTGLTPNNTRQYNNEFYLQIAFKGLGDVGTGNPSKLLSSITGYKSQFGQEF